MYVQDLCFRPDGALSGALLTLGTAERALCGHSSTLALASPEEWWYSRGCQMWLWEYQGPSLSRFLFEQEPALLFTKRSHW